LYHGLAPKRINYVKFTLTREAKIGLMVFITLACAVWGFNYLKGIDLFVNNRYFYTVFDHAEGLEVSAPIQLNGFKIGSVASVELMESTGQILVQLRISESKVKITEGSQVVLASPSLLSGKIIDLKPGPPGTEIPEDDTLASSIETDLMADMKGLIVPLKDKAEHLIEAIDSVVTPLQQVVNRETAANLRKSMAELPAIMQNVKRMTADASTFTGLLKRKEGDIDALITNLRELSDTLATLPLQETVTQVNQTLESIASLLEDIQHGEGTAAALIQDPKLYQSLDSASTNLQHLLYDLKSNPERYLHFSLIKIERKKAKE